MADLSSLEKYLKPAYVENGDEVKICDEGKIIEKEFGGKKRLSFEITVQLPNGDIKFVSMNRTSRNILGSAWGFDTKNWIGKRAVITKNNMLINGQMKDVLIFQAAEEN
jgi:hypothetical protein